MTLRYQSGSTNVPAAGATLAHGLVGTPTEFVAQKMEGGTGIIYFAWVSSTNVVVAANGAGSANVQCSIPHSIMNA